MQTFPQPAAPAVTPPPAAAPRRPAVLVLNRSYWPDVEATGQLLAELCSDLVAGAFDVRVIAGEPNLASSDGRFAAVGTHTIDGVSVIRVSTKKFSKSSLWSRGLGLLSYFFQAGWKAAWGRRPDAIVVETDPPFLLALGGLLKWKHRRPLVCYLQDLHPEVGLALGRFKPGPITWALKAMTQFGLKRADRVVVLGEDMRRRVEARGVPADRIHVVPNWADTSNVRPGPPSERLRAEWGLSGKFVVMYSGNLGLSQNLHRVLDAAALLKDATVTFAFVGDGAYKRSLQERVAAERLENVKFFPYQPKDRLSESLGAADVHLVTLQGGLAGYIVPSKLYGILAAGRPYIAAVPAEGETAAVTERGRCGLRVDPDNPAALADTVRWCLDHREELAEMGVRGRELAESEFDRKVSTGKFAAVLATVVPTAKLVVTTALQPT